MNIYAGIGHVSNDPKVRTFNRNDGTQGFATNLNLAVNYRYGNETKAAFLPLSIFGQGATNLKKGDKIAIEAEVQDATYTDANNVTHFGVQFVVNSGNWEYVIPKSKLGNGNNQQTQATSQAQPQPQTQPQAASQPSVPQQMSQAQQPMYNQAPMQNQMPMQQMTPQAAPQAPVPQQMPQAQPQAQPQMQMPVNGGGYPEIPDVPANLPFN